MSVGGRGTSTRRGSLKRGNSALPNLSIAGKRETKSEASGTRGQRRGGKRERGGRGGRGRGGRGREAGKPVFIEQQGIFSSGLNDDGRHDRPKSSIPNEFGVPKLERIKKLKSEDGVEDRDVKPITYESEWLSDEEADNEELQELLRDGFISDMKPGKVIPLILPETEETQFRQLAVKEEEIMENGCESMDASSLPPTKRKKKKNRRLSIDSESEEDVKNPLTKEMKTATAVQEDPTATSSRRAAAIMEKVQEDEDGSILMLQLPSTLSALKDSSSQEGTEEKSKPEENAGLAIKHCLDGFANGSRIGKLRVRKGGRMELLICGMPLDVTCGVSSRHNESVLLIDSESQSGTSAVKSECGDEQSPSRGYVLGKVVNSFICSHNLSEALDGKREDQEQDKRNSHAAEDQKGDGEDPEMKDLLQELRSIERKEESWAKWTLEYSDSSKYDDS